MTADETPTERHLPRPGPDYWAWRCLVCSEPVANRSRHWGPMSAFVAWLTRGRKRHA